MKYSIYPAILVSIVSVCIFAVGQTGQPAQTQQQQNDPLFREEQLERKNQNQNQNDQLFQPGQPPNEPNPSSQMPPGEEPFNPNELTPNLSLPSNMWSRTSPGWQIALGAGDLIFLGYMNQFYDPEFREAARKFRAQDKIEKGVQRDFDNLKKKIAAEETSLQEIERERDALKADIDNLIQSIKTRNEELEKAQRILTIDDKEAALRRTQTALAELHHEAMLNHQGPLLRAEDIYRYLSTAELKQLQTLTEQYNALREMPSVNSEQKEVIIRDAKAAVSRAEDARNGNINRSRTIDTEITQQTREIESMKGELAQIEGRLKIEKASSAVLEKDMSLIAKSKRIRMITRRVVRFGGKLIGGIDLAGRIYLFAVVQEDPGWFPFATLLQRVLL